MARVRENEESLWYQLWHDCTMIMVAKACTSLANSFAVRLGLLWHAAG